MNIHASLRNASIFELLEGISTMSRRGDSNDDVNKRLSFVGRTKPIINSSSTEKYGIENFVYSNSTSMILNLSLTKEGELFCDAPFTEWQRNFLTTAPWDVEIHARNITFSNDVKLCYESIIMADSNTTIEVRELEANVSQSNATNEQNAIIDIIEDVTEDEQDEQDKLETREINEDVWLQHMKSLETYDNVGTNISRHIFIEHHEKDEAIDVQFQYLDTEVFFLIIFVTMICILYAKREWIQKEYQSLASTNNVNALRRVTHNLPSKEQSSEEEYIDSLTSSPLPIYPSDNEAKNIESDLEGFTSVRYFKKTFERPSRLNDGGSVHNDADDESLLEPEVIKDVNHPITATEESRLRHVSFFVSNDLDFPTFGVENGRNDQALEQEIHEEKQYRIENEDDWREGSPERTKGLQCTSCANHIKSLETKNAEQRICIFSLERQIKEQSISIMNLESHIESLNYEMMKARHDHQVEQERLENAYEELKNEASELADWMKCQISCQSPERKAQIEKYKEESDLESLTLSEKENLKQEIEEERSVWMSELTDIQLSFSARSARERDCSDDSSMGSCLSMDSEEM